MAQYFFFKAKGGFNNIQLITEQLCSKGSLARACLLVVAFGDTLVTVTEKAYIYICVCVYHLFLALLVGGSAGKALELKLCVHQ